VIDQKNRQHRKYLIDLLTESVYFLKNKGFEITEGPITVVTSKLLDLFYGLQLFTRDFRFEACIHAVAEADNIYQYAVLFIISKFSNSKRLFPTLRVEIVDWSRKSRDFAAVVLEVIDHIIGNMKVLDKPLNLKEIKKEIEDTYNIESNLAYIEVNERWFRKNAGCCFESFGDYQRV